MNANIWNRFSRRAGWRPPTAHLLHIGKTGGTAIKTALEHHARGAHYTLAVHPHRFALADVPASEYAVFFLRDPMSRFISGFHSRKRQGAPRYHFPWSPEEALAFGRFDTPNDLALSLSSPDPDVRQAARDGMRSIKHVRDGFAHWLGSVEYLEQRRSGLLFIGFQEHLTEDFDALKRVLGCPDVALPTDEMAAHRAPAGLDRHLEPQAIENLSAWYAEDYRILSVCRRIADGLRRLAG